MEHQPQSCRSPSLYPPTPPSVPLLLSLCSPSVTLPVLSPNCFASSSASLSICMQPHSPPSLCTSIMPPMNVLLTSLSSLSNACWSLYTHTVYVLLPIILSIPVFLLLTGWKGVRGGLSQLIYHIKYQPSRIFSPSSPHSPIHPSLPSLPFLHLLPFISLLLTCPHHSFITWLTPSPSRSHSLTRPTGALLKVPIPHFFKQLPYASEPHLPPPHRDPRSLSPRFPSLSCAGMHSQPITADMV